VSIIGSDLKKQRTYVFLLFVNVTDLEPDIGVGEGTGWISENTVKTGKRLFVFALLFVDDTKTEKNLICLVEI